MGWDTAGEPETSVDSYSVLTLVAFVVGLLSLCAWLLPICGFPLAIVGLVLSVIARRSRYPHVVAAAVVLCLVGFVASMLNAALGVQAFLSGGMLRF